MRRILLCSALALLLVVSNLSPRPAAAEEEQAPPPWYFELLRPREASSKIQKTMKEFPRRQQRIAMQRMATEYLDAWKRSGLEHGEHELDALYSLNFSAQRYGEALALMLPRVHDEALALNLRAAAAGRASSILRNYRMAESLGEEAETEAVAAVQAILPLLEGDEHAATRGTLHTALAAHAGRQEDEEAQVRHLLLAAEATPTSAGAAARTIVRLLQGKAHDMAGYEAVRKRADEVLPKLQAIAAAFLEKAKAAGDEGQTKRGETLVEQLEKVDRPLQMLGEPVSAWTLEHAFGDVQALAELEGKVVVLDFWATWCPWCIRSFPAIRDLLKEYADKDLAVVGVTASASAVYEHRFDLDDDLKDKAVEGERPKAVARLARDGQKKDGDPPMLPEAEYREVEREALVRFIENHQMTWPVVMIAKEEPGPKYALAGWPHAVVIDRQGRVRYFKSGALLREKAETVAAFRKVLDDLLAEEAAPAAE